MAALLLAALAALARLPTLASAGALLLLLVVFIPAASRRHPGRDAVVGPSGLAVSALGAGVANVFVVATADA